jgi:uncharacterized protein (TIGR00299 family) protein
MRIGYLECFAGISGDMMLGALIDAGVPFADLERVAATLDVGAQLEMRKVMRGGIAATKVDVLIGNSRYRINEEINSHGKNEHLDAANSDSAHLQEPHNHPEPTRQSHRHAVPVHSAHSHATHRSLSSVLAIIRSAPLTEPVRARSIRAFELLGHAEAAIHGVPIESVHFHEVGAVDTIVDIVCSAAGCELLGIDRWMASPLNVGSGTVNCQHGTLPVPAPATLALLGDAPVYSAGPAMERVTPTGAAVLRMLDVTYGPLPAIRVQASGYGAGGRDTAGEPNLLRMLIGEGDDSAQTNASLIAIVETVVDDSSPQLLGYVSELLFNAGAWDVYHMPVQMKKGRTGVQLTVLCSPDLVPAVRDLIFRETTTIGLHWRIENKVALARAFVDVETSWGLVQVKVARWPSGEPANASPEYEHCRRIAEEHRLPLKQVMQEVMRIYAATYRLKDGD